MLPFHQESLKQLIDFQGRPAISIYMPTHQVSSLQDEQDRIRFKNALDQAALRLQDHGIAAGNVDRILGPAKDLIEDTMFWSHQSHGLAVFMAAGFFKAYRLPLDFDEHVLVDSRFHIPPLMGFFDCMRPFFVLSLSQHHVKLFKGNKLEIEEVEVAGLPKNMQEVLRFDEFEKEHQYRDIGGGGANSAWHAGEEIYGKKEQLATFMHTIDKCLQPILMATQAPLVLACVDYLGSIYRHVSHYPFIIDGTISGNQVHTQVKELHAQAWTLVEPVLAEDREHALAHFAELSDTERIVCSTAEVTKAAYGSRIETLFLLSDIGPRGEISLEGEVEIHADLRRDDADLVNLATIYTLLNGGEVFTVSRDELQAVMPASLKTGREMAAILRY